MRFLPYFWFGQTWLSVVYFRPLVRVLRCVVAKRLAQSATGRQPTTEILLPVQREVNI